MHLSRKYVGRRDIHVRNRYDGLHFVVPSIDTTYNTLYRTIDPIHLTQSVFTVLLQPKRKYGSLRHEQTPYCGTDSPALQYGTTLKYGRHTSSSSSYLLLLPPPPLCADRTTVPTNIVLLR